MKFAFLPLMMAMTDTTKTAVVTNPADQRAPTVRPFTLPKEGSLRTKSLEDRTKDMNDLFQAGSPLSDEELDDIVHSVQNICPASSSTTTVDFDKLRSTLLDIAHISHKDWAVTEANSKVLGNVLLKEGVATPAARQMLERIRVDGNWDGAANHAKSKNHNNENPWAVLVTGVNGIRKTTSVYQSWWPQLLQEALVPPLTTSDLGTTTNGKRKSPDEIPLECLPTGANSFFRQLDHMIATLCNEDFKALYCLAEQQMMEDNKNNDNNSNNTPSADLVKKYSDLKAAIFSRYRTLSELLGALLLKEAQEIKSNCMMETSGRDVAMFHYVDHFFPKEVGYNKLALHFTINDLSQAQESVDRRMVQEIQDGIQAVNNKDDFDVIYANAGGPYGSDVLPGVQEASDAVWNDVVLKGQVGQDWYKATIAINAHATEPWTAQAVRPDGSLGTEFLFSNKKQQ